MIYGALSSLALYALVSVLRARHRYLVWHRFWCPQRSALRALSLMSQQETK